MADEWFYGRNESRLGPFSSAQLRELASAGKIEPTDTVWKAGIEKGVLAHKVKNLFPSAEVAPPPEPPTVPPPPPTALPPPEVPVRSEVQPLTGGSKTFMPPKPQKEPERKARATAGRGAILVSQDGHAVHYRKKCIKCDFIGPSKHRMVIRSGVTRLSFYCPKCRKLQPVEISGHL
jgi:hypothetical protein